MHWFQSPSLAKRTNLELMLISLLGCALIAMIAAISGQAALAADPPQKIDCSKYTGTEREACEKMMGKKKQ